MIYNDITNPGFIDDSGLIAALGAPLLTDEEKSGLRGQSEKLERLWQNVSGTCPRECAARREEARRAALDNPTDEKALALYQRLESESAEFIATRHAAAHAVFRDAVVALAPLAVKVLERYKAEMQSRTETAKTKWAEITALFPRSFADLPLDEIVTGKTANSLRAIDEQIAQLAKPSENSAAVVLSNFGLLDLKASRQVTCA